jgi:hypothetical protein
MDCSFNNPINFLKEKTALDKAAFACAGESVDPLHLRRHGEGLSRKIKRTNFWCPTPVVLGTYEAGVTFYVGITDVLLLFEHKAHLRVP